jgi:fructokinase
MTIGAIEAGGTKFVCAVLSAEPNGAQPLILERTSVATGRPEATLAEVLDFFKAAQSGRGAIERLGIGSFGPIDPIPGSPSWGKVLATPKPGWAGADLAGYFKRALGVPVAFDTDVNAAALGERLWGAAQGLDDFIYLTVGTGIGGGAFANGRLVHGASHPEMGHIRLARLPGDSFAGACPFHDSCFEGLAAGPAIERRWGMKGADIPAEHEAWALEASYLAQGIASLCLAYSPRLFILGGGVGGRPDMLARTRQALPSAFGGYRPGLASAEDTARLLVAPGLGPLSGLLGSAALALDIR